MWLPGLTMLAFCENSLLLGVLCTGLQVMGIWDTLGVSFLGKVILFEQWAGHRLLSENVAEPHVCANRRISISFVPVSEGIEIRQGCQFISSLVRALDKLSGGTGRFLSCRVGSHMSRLRHIQKKKKNRKNIMKRNARGVRLAQLNLSG